MQAAGQTTSVVDVLGSYLFRIGVYAVAMLVGFEAVYAGIRAYGPELMGAENGPIESTQVLLAVIGAIGLFWAACLSPIGRSALVICGAVVTYAAARESDLLFEQHLFDDAYKWLVGLPMFVLCIAVLLTDRRPRIGDMISMMRHPAGTLFGIAGLFLCIVCQVFDRPEMWLGIGTEQSVATTKALIEEVCELFAYLLIAFSGVEAALLGRRRKHQSAAQNGEESNAEIYSIAA